MIYSKESKPEKTGETGVLRSAFLDDNEPTKRDFYGMETLQQLIE